MWVHQGTDDPVQPGEIIRMDGVVQLEVTAIGIDWMRFWDDEEQEAFEAGTDFLMRHFEVERNEVYMEGD